ncbi:hypothetical protein VPH80_004643 [Vibrio parahaemolyticus]|uniref:hypothetical protein n=1 Tax=Salinivibrio sp. ML290 TaxID=1909468 RepID=UPI000988621A|nr:hypothetical protein [Salinivibrio sp. ML290]EHJ9977320.1 hypothetical protein [Vibrio parahaemolyticus]HDZ9500521.1 hypothetical protein [Vibrio cholerae]EMC9925365.1 hypothetical protein [Vibrio parahaemolyticus]OOE77100.1 hypothetical protein BZG23_01870 [Salinivibrio sp. ML290]HCG8222944.1 hypothetical protein [Vibrio parahaemolyticus]
MLNQELGHKLKIKFGTPELTNYQILCIKNDIKSLVARGVTPTESDWAEVVKRHCPQAGSYFYKGADTSDLITLLQLATKD